MKVILEPGDNLTVILKDTDGMFEIHYNSSMYPGKLVIEETGGMPGNIKGEANTIMYEEDFSDLAGIRSTVMRKYNLLPDFLKYDFKKEFGEPDKVNEANISRAYSYLSKNIDEETDAE